MMRIYAIKTYILNVISTFNVVNIPLNSNWVMKNASMEFTQLHTIKREMIHAQAHNTMILRAICIENKEHR